MKKLIPNLKLSLISFVLLTNGICLNAQTLYRVNNVEVFQNGKKLKNPFTGGFNASIVNQMDLNNDKKLDLVIFNYNSNKINTFLNVGGKGSLNYLYSPVYETFFPRTLNGMFSLRDVNNDGMEDIVYVKNNLMYIDRGIRTNDTTFNFVIQDTIIANSYIAGIYPSTISVPNGYAPVVRDMDKDGDIDILSVDLSSNRILFYKNFRNEQGKTGFNNVFYKENYFWGQCGFYLNPMSFRAGVYPTILHGLAQYSVPLVPRHDEYQMVWELDANNDGKWDAIGYSENQNNSPLGLNVGTLDSAYIINIDTFFPSYSKSIHTYRANGFNGDLTNDSMGDILVFSIMERDINSSVTLSDKIYNDDIKTLRYYENKGTQTYRGVLQNKYEFQGDTFLSADQIDVGTGSRPIFFDYNMDSLMDILIPNITKRDSFDESNITSYKNIGTKTYPKYILDSRDFLGFKSKHRLNICIATGDLNSDGIKDLLISSYKSLGAYTPGVNPNTHIFYDVYYGNYNNGNPIFLIDTIQTLEKTLYYGQVNTCLYDVNKDGLLDLFVGNYYNIDYYKNIGTKTKPQFELVNENVVNVKDLYEYYSSNFFNFYPAVFKDPSNQKEYLYYAYSDEINKIGRSIIDTFRLNHDTTLVTDGIDLYKLSIGISPSLTFGDFNHDNTIEMLLGNYAGGIQLYSFSNFDTTTKPVDPGVSIAFAEENTKPMVFPNPFNNEITISHLEPKSFPIQCSLYDYQGRLVFSTQTKLSKIVLPDNLSNGNYLLFIKDKQETTRSFHVTKSQ